MLLSNLEIYITNGNSQNQNSGSFMKLKTIIISAILGFTLASPLTAEFVFITDGSILQGNVIGDTAGAITFAVKNGGTKVIPRNKIMRILYTEFYMGKIFVNKIDGTVIEVYMVDEDTNTYTFRKDITKPVEFIIKREEVLFTTRTNPVGLTGKASSETISIEWKAPYTPVRHYKVYVRSGNEYKLYSEPSGKSETLKGLKGNTDYKIKVTAIDKDGIESMPSNEIKIKTLNIPPNPPEKIKVKREVEKNNKKMSANISWAKANDVDGKIKSYKIYQLDKKEPYIANSNNYEVKNLNPEDTYFFYLTAIDDFNEESDKSRRVSTYDYKGYNISIQPNYIVPFGTFKKVHKYGYGGLLSGTRENTFFEDFEIGASIGYWQYQGVVTETARVDYSMMVPLIFTAGYRFNIADIFYIIPRIGLGGSYNYIKYQTEPELYTGYGLTMEPRTKWSIEPLVLAGVAFEYDITHRFYLMAAADMGMIIEMRGVVPFAVATFGAGIRF